MKRRYLLAIILFCTTLLLSQELQINPANLDDPRVTFTNSSVMGIHEGGQFVAGYERFFYHLPNDGLYNGIIGFHYSLNTTFSTGVHVEYFNSELYRRGIYRANAAALFGGGKYGIGIDMGVLNVSYNPDQFQLDDLNDPVFAEKNSRNSLDIGISGFATFLKNLYLGVAARHINTPTLSLNDDSITLPLSLNVGLVYKNNYVTPLLSFCNAEHWNEWEFGLQKWLFQRIVVQGFFSPSRYGLYSYLLFPFANNSFRVGYQLSIPTSDIRMISDNSHQLLLAYGFKPSKADFKIQATPVSQTIYQGESAKYKIDFITVKDFLETIHTTIDGNLNEITPTLLPNYSLKSIQPYLVLTTQDSTPPFAYNFILRGVSKHFSSTFDIELVVKKLPLIKVGMRVLTERLIITEKIHITRRNPILPFIFFKHNSADLDSSKYVLVMQGESLEEVLLKSSHQNNQIMNHYRNTLNVIAKRLHDDPQFKIELVGFNDGKGLERENLTLSEARAQAVKNYLVNNCGVLPKQIQTRAGNLPDHPSAQDDPLGDVENRRVEIRKVNEEDDILEPVVLSAIETTKSDEACQFQISELVAQAGIHDWTLTILDAKQDTFAVYKGMNKPDSLLFWDWKSRDGRTVMAGDVYSCQMELRDSLEQQASSQRHDIRVVGKEVQEKEIDLTRLILFKFDKSIIAFMSKTMMRQLETAYDLLISNPRSTVEIHGHTDIIGLYERNVELSIERAQAIANYFYEKGIQRDRITFFGHGPDIPLLPNDSPEGRMMNRRVELLINIK